MEMENIIGAILEEYIYSICKDQKWIWCSGDIVKAIDFIKKNEDGTWEMLQVKNSDNSENSSSKKLEKAQQSKCGLDDTQKRKEFNWEELNRIMKSNTFSEDNFLTFLANKLKA